MKTVQVVAGIILNPEKNKILVSLRKKSAHQGGLWEFPGGKIEQNETPEVALNRELKEELDISVVEAELFMTEQHDYTDKQVNIQFYLVHQFKGEPKSMEDQPIQWVTISDLDSLQFPQANIKAIEKVQIVYREM